MNLNQLLFHAKTDTLSFFKPPFLVDGPIDGFFEDMETQLKLQDRPLIAGLLNKNKPAITKILSLHKDKSHGFFISEKLQGYIVLETLVETYCVFGRNFHVRPLLEEFFVNPEYMLVNISLYEIQIFRGDFHHLEIMHHYEFDQMAQSLGAGSFSRVFAPDNIGLIPYKTLLALKTIAQKINDMSEYHSIPVLVTGLDVMKEVLLKHISHREGVVFEIPEDFHEKTCVQMLATCKKYRNNVMDFYSAQFKARLTKMVKSKRLITDLSSIIKAAQGGKIHKLVIPVESKLWGTLNFETGDFEIVKASQKKDSSVDILNELAEEVMKHDGTIQILGPHFFPKDAHVLAILRG